MRRFLVDTDTACDDAVALVMALRADDVEVEAVTVVAGNVPLDQGIQNALYTTELCGVDVPVYAGAAAPLLRPLSTSQSVLGADGMGDCGLPLVGRTPDPGRAADVIVDAASSGDGLTLVTLGPLTNVAIAVARAPEIVERIERVVIMGGTGVHGPGNVTPLAEFNIWVDPEAAQIVMRSGLPIELVGWDISIASAIVDREREDQLRALDTELATFAMDIQGEVMDLVRNRLGQPGSDLPDPIAMAHALDPDPAATVRHHVEVLLGVGPQRGAFEVDRLGATRRPANATIVTDYPSDHFFDLLAASLR